MRDELEIIRKYMNSRLDPDKLLVKAILPRNMQWITNGKNWKNNIQTLIEETI